MIWSKYEFSMNLLSSSSYFHNKNPFSISFISFKQSLDWATISENSRGPAAKDPKTQNTMQKDGGSILVFPEVSFAK